MPPYITVNARKTIVIVVAMYSVENVIRNFSGYGF